MKGKAVRGQTDALNDPGSNKFRHSINRQIEYMNLTMEWLFFFVLPRARGGREGSQRLAICKKKRKGIDYICRECLEKNTLEK